MVVMKNTYRFNKTKLLSVVKKSLEDPRMPHRLHLFLDVMEVEYENDFPKFEAIKEPNSVNDTCCVYLNIKDSDFYLEMFVRARDYKVLFCHPLPKFEIEYVCYNDRLSLRQIIESVKIKPDEVNNLKIVKDKTTGKHKTLYAISFTTYKAPDEFEHKFNYLLNKLWSDQLGFKSLVEQSGHNTIYINTFFHVYNGELEIHHFSHRQLLILNQLGLTVKFRHYPQGDNIFP